MHMRAHARAHTHTGTRACTHRFHTLPLKWKLWLSTALVFLPFQARHVQQTDQALFKVQCTLLLLHCHQKPLMKCLISLWGYLFLVHWPDGTFSSGTWNLSFALVLHKVTGHTIFIENRKDSCILRWLGVFKLVTLSGTHAGEGLPPPLPPPLACPQSSRPPFCSEAEGTCLLSVRFLLKMKIMFKAALAELKSS